MMKLAATALVLLAALSAPALAGPCDTDLPALKSALASSQAQPDVKTQVQDMVAQAEKLCEAGNGQEAADVLAEASSMLLGQ
jgi:hypothetical protein